MAGESAAGAFNTAANIFQTEQNRNFQREMLENQQNYGTAEANRQRLWEEGMYQKYHSPAAQIRQIKEAGLSPALLYAQGLGSGAGVFHGGNPSNPGVGTPQSFGASTQGESIADIALARRTNIEADLLEEFGGEKERANIDLIKAKEDVAQSEKSLNEALSNQAEKQAEWQGWQSKIAEIDSKIKAATMEDAISMVGEQLENIRQANEWYKQQVRESKNRITNLDKITEEQARWYHSQTYVAFANAYTASLGNQVTEKTIDTLVDLTFISARKALAEAKNEEDFPKRFEAEMKQRIRDNQTTLEAAGIIASSNVIGGIGKMLGAGGMRNAKSIGNMGRYTRTTTQKLPGGKTITETRNWPVQWGGYGTYGGYGRF